MERNTSFTEDKQSGSAKICPPNISQVKANPCTNRLKLRIFFFSSFFSGVHNVEDCNFQIFNG